MKILTSNTGAIRLSDKIVSSVDHEECTSFDVFPTLSSIPSGTKDSVEELSVVLGWTEEDISAMSSRVFNRDIAYINEVEPENRLVLYFESYFDGNDNDIEIDFGDGTPRVDISREFQKPIPADTAENIGIDGLRAKVYYTSQLIGFEIQHTYARSGKYNVKIYGSSYHTLRAWNYLGNRFSTAPKDNLVCRFLENGLQVHSCLQNMSSFAAGQDNAHMNTRLLRVNQQSYFNMKNLNNLAGGFGRCSNLREAYLDNINFDGRLKSFHGMFYMSSNLVSTNVYLAPCTEQTKGGYTQTFYGCENLRGNISSYLKPNYHYDNMVLDSTFYNCKALSGRVPAEQLWGSNSQTVIGLNQNTFKGCTGLNLNDVPISFGGYSLVDTTPVHIRDLVQAVSQISSDISNVWGDISSDVQTAIFDNIRIYSNFDEISCVISSENGFGSLDGDPPTLNLISGYYIKKTDGSLAPRTDSYTSEKIYNFGKDRCIKYTNLVGIQNTACAIAAFDADGNIISSKSLFYKEGAGSGSLIWFNGEFTFDDDVSYVMLGISRNSNISYKTTMWIGHLMEKTDILFNQLSSLENLVANEISVVGEKDITELSIKHGYFLNSYGLESINANYSYTDKIYNCGKPIVFENLKGANGAAYYVVAFDERDKILRDYSLPNPLKDPDMGSGAPIWGSGTYDFDSSVAYVRCQLPNPVTSSQKIHYYDNMTIKEFVSRAVDDMTREISVVNEKVDSIEEYGTQWRGKKWFAYGTSLTNGTYGFYPNWLSSKAGLILTNKGAPGETIALSSSESSHGSGRILRLISADSESGALSSVDLITIEGFVNDWNYGRPLGEFNDGQLSTLHGSLEQAIKCCLSGSNATVVLLTDNGGRENYKTTTVKNGLRLRQYNDEVVKIAKDMGVHCIDVAAKAQINEWSNPAYYADNSVHHSELGGRQYAATIWEELKNIHCTSTI